MDETNETALLEFETTAVGHAQAVERGVDPDDSRYDEARAAVLARMAPGPRIEFHQADWIPGFAAFVDDGKKLTRDPSSRAFCVLNLGSFLAAIQTGDLSHEDLAREIADSMCHEVLHVVEKWCGIEFSEDRVNGLLDRYREHALAGDATPPQPGAGREP